MSLRLTPEQYHALTGRLHAGKKTAAARSTEEHDFQRRVLELAERYGWLSHHETDSRRSRPGWPDLVLAKPGQPLIIAELKSRRGKVTVPQRCWLEVLERAAGLEVHLWRPCDWNLITEILQR